MAALVLVAEDHDDTREIVLEALTAAGFEAVAARDGVEALDKARRLRPAVIVLDGSMPALDGLAAAAALKADDATRGIRILLVTGHVETLAGRARDAGVDAFASKPLSPIDLVRHVEALAGR